MKKPIVHWLGAGLASAPGIRRLIKNGHQLVLWERDLDKANHAVAGLTGNFQICEAKEGALEAWVKAGDIVVSMLPAHMHIAIADLCLAKKAHFVSSSYISKEMADLDGPAKSSKLSFVNEVGLDPGIDHLLAHLLIADYKASALFDPANQHSFRSYCGGFPALPNDFKYKFSWSPLGVLKALKSPARSIEDGQIKEHPKAWDAVSKLNLRFVTDEEQFECYPNRDSLPFIPHYAVGEDWQLSEFVRGTLRLDGWAEAWSAIFKTLDRDRTEGNDLKGLSERLWVVHAYQEGELDRVVLTVELEVKRQNKVIWHKSKCINAFGNDTSTAMGRLVSVPVSLAVESLLSEQLPKGVQAAPSNINLIHHWLKEIAVSGDHVQHIDHMEEPMLIAAE